MDKLSMIATLVVVFIYSVLVSASFGYRDGITSMQKMIVEQGYGEYCSGTGDFAWIGECK